MERQIEKFPYKKTLYLQWFEAAIANLILFKYLREKLSNHIYFLISDQGVTLKATSSSYLRTAQDEIDRFFNAKIEQLDVCASSDFYEHILSDIKQQTQKLKDTRDCPYINLVYSEKLKNSCLALKKFGYARPYENWEICEREKRGFCYLIVRPEHRWKQIASNVTALIKKRESSAQKSSSVSNWIIEMNFEEFIWFFLHPSFQKLKPSLQIKEKKGESLISVAFKQDSQNFMDFDKAIKNIEYRYCEEKVTLNDKQKEKIHMLSTLELEKITQLIYHQFGLPNLVREVRGRGLKFLAVGFSEDLASVFVPELKLALIDKPKFHLREDISRIKNQQAVGSLLRLGKRHDLVSYNGLNYVMVRFELPLKHNAQLYLKQRLPSLPRYFYYIERNKDLYILRKFEETRFKGTLDGQTLPRQIFLMNSLIIIIQQLHRRGVAIGCNFSDCIFAENLKVVVEPAETGNMEEDRSRLVLLVREWVKGMKSGELKNDLQKLNNPLDMLPIFDIYLNENYV